METLVPFFIYKTWPLAGIVPLTWYTWNEHSTTRLSRRLV